MCGTAWRLLWRNVETAQLRRATRQGFRVIALGAFIGQHAENKEVAVNRPDEKDKEVQMDIQPTVTYWSEDFVVEIWVSELTSLRIYS